MPHERAVKRNLSNVKVNCDFFPFSASSGGSQVYKQFRNPRKSENFSSHFGDELFFSRSLSC